MEVILQEDALRYSMTENGELFVMTALEKKTHRLVIDRTQGNCGVCDVPKVLEHGNPQLAAFHQSQAEKSLAEHSLLDILGNTFVFRQLREQRLENVGYVL